MKTFSGIEKEQICLFFLAFLCFHSFSNNFEKGQRGEEVNLRLVQTRIGIKENGKEGEGANTLKSKMETFSWRHFRELIQGANYGELLFLFPFFSLRWEKGRRGKGAN